MMRWWCRCELHSERRGRKTGFAKIEILSCRPSRQYRGLIRKGLTLSLYEQYLTWTDMMSFAIRCWYGIATRTLEANSMNISTDNGSLLYTRSVIEMNSIQKSGNADSFAMLLHSWEHQWEHSLFSSSQECCTSKTQVHVWWWWFKTTQWL